MFTESFIMVFRCLMPASFCKPRPFFMINNYKGHVFHLTLIGLERIYKSLIKKILRMCTRGLSTMRILAENSKLKTLKLHWFYKK